MAVKNRIAPVIFWLLLTLVGCGGEMVESIHPEPGDVEETLDALVVPGPTDTQGPADTSDSSADALDAAQAGDSASAAGPILIEAEVTWSGWNEVIRAEPGTFGLATVAGLLLQDEEGAVSVVGANALEQALDGSLEPLVTGVDLGGDGSLLAGESGLTGLVEGQLAPSPLNEHIEQPIIAMTYDSVTDQLWLSTGAELLLHEEGALYVVDTGELPSGPARLAYGGHVDGEPAVWVASGSSVYSLVGAGDNLDIGAWVEGLDPIDMACDAEGRVWLSVDGDLYRRSTDGLWDWLRLPSPVGALAASPNHDALWIHTTEGLWRHEGGQFGPVDGAAAGTWLDVDSEGALVLSGDAGVWRMGVGDQPLPPPPPTWSEDIQSISEASCVLCHGPGALGAAQMYLREQWEERIDDILLVVSSGAMPLPPNPVLEPATIATIEAWKAAGFPE